MGWCKEPLSKTSMKYPIGVFKKSIRKKSSIQDFYVSVTANIPEAHFFLLIRSPQFYTNVPHEYTT